MIDGEQDVLTNSVDEAEAEAEAERIFDELAAEREREPGDSPADDEPGKAADDGAGDQSDTAGAGQGDEPGQTGGSGDEAAAAAAESGEGDIWANADPKLKAAYEAAENERKRAEQQFRSREGREAAYQRRIAELEAGQRTEPQPPLKKLLEDPKIKEIVEEYPDFQTVIDKMGQIAERVDGVEGRVSEVSVAASDAVYAAEEKRLAERVPEWVELAQDDRFQAWVDDQPAKVRAVVRDNWNAITDAAAAAEVFETFRGHISPEAKAEESKGGKPGKRDRQASSAKAATVSSPSSASGDSDDPDVLFQQLAAKKDRERGIR